ncbi:MAG: prepilin-type N-terminal cleavage/methylation domain-containing protein, partial [Actinobacteria bacterium]|nr:prepilin-type N-terminal cleavage/methylation domain-containing protein [Actinomycetota bacterium]
MRGVVNKNNQAGSTIVEVLVALTIISVVVSGAYATASRSTSITRQSQERT